MSSQSLVQAISSLSAYSLDLKSNFSRLGNLQILSALLAVWVASRVVKLIKGISAVNGLRGMRIPFQPLDFPGALIPTTWWNPGVTFTWLWRFTFYRRFQSENVSIVPFLSGIPVIYTNNLDVARQVASGGHKSSFIKPESASQSLLLWGMNLVAADGDTWRKHRRIMGPAFNNKLYQMVWTETLKTYREMVSAENWNSQTLALLIIGKCGFGFSFDWTAPPTAPDGSMPIQEALRIVADSNVLMIAAPKWLLNLPFQRFKEVREAHSQLMGFMRKQVENRKSDISGQSYSTANQNDAFTLLVKANEDEASKLRLDDQELIGNVFIMLFAETTAHTLAATLGFLGLHQDIQEEVVEQIVSVVGWDRDPEYQDYASLNKVLAAFYEALRMFPAGFIMIREATEDTVLQIPNPPGEDGTTPFPVPKGVQVLVDMIGIQYNPRYFEEPEAFKPSRWYNTSSESDTFSAFSIGPRACIGRKFATTEAVAFLTMLLRDYKVEPILKDGETKEEWRKRVLDGRIVLTLGVADVGLRVVNTGNHSVVLLNTPKSLLTSVPTDKFRISHESGATPTFIGVKPKDAEGGLASVTKGPVTVLTPGQSFEVIHDLSKAYNFTMNGGYTIVPSNQFYAASPTHSTIPIYAEVEAFTIKLARQVLGHRDIDRCPKPSFANCSASQQAFLLQATKYAESYARQAYENGGVLDFVYTQPLCKELAIRNASQAIFNANSYEYFAENDPTID
ncbi:hypothetical protein H0H93_000745 [Arthromyces matolae]|nr:hypothetical protein H0H93_000745 [Arthromyces matolae]